MRLGLGSRTRGSGRGRGEPSARVSAILLRGRGRGRGLGLRRATTGTDVGGVDGFGEHEILPSYEEEPPGARNEFVTPDGGSDSSWAGSNDIDMPNLTSRDSQPAAMPTPDLVPGEATGSDSGTEVQEPAADHPVLIHQSQETHRA